MSAGSINLTRGQPGIMRILNLILAFYCLTIVQGIQAQTYGCTDPTASNYNSSATVNNGSCTYASASADPVSGVPLPETLIETSGLIHWNNGIWTHNDSDDKNIYSLDTVSGAILRSVELTGTVNTDWEEISEDRDFIYIGDFGNNYSGNRTDLKILKVSKSSVLSGLPAVETINFSYPDQANYNPAAPNSTDFDCEAMIVSKDSIYLFTKQWVSGGTALYSLAKTPGTHVAKRKSVYNVRGLITGAVYLEPERLIALCGYNKILEPFIFLLYDFKGTDFFGGNKRKISVALPYHQVEAITTADGLKFYITNENFTQPDFLTVLQQLHILNLTPFLENYYSMISAVPGTGVKSGIFVFPVPTKDFITIKSKNSFLPVEFRLSNMSGQVVINGRLTEERQSVSLTGLPYGLYFFTLKGTRVESVKIVKQ